MIKVEDLQLMAVLANSGSLTEAARSLNVTPAALSIRLRALEKQLGISLALRTSRRLRLSADGEILAREASQIVGKIEGLPELVQKDGRKLSGSLKIAAPFGYGRQKIAPLIVRFVALYPNINIQLDLRETPWPDHNDADIVIHVGDVRDTSWVARTLCHNERWLCASPSYLERNGIPESPSDLLTHAFISIKENEQDGSLWHFRREKVEGESRLGVRRSLRVRPALVSNDGGTARYWAEQGLGLVLRSQWDVEESILQGKLVRVLDGWHFDPAPVLIMVPTRKGLPARVRSALSFFVSELGRESVRTMLPIR